MVKKCFHVFEENEPGLSLRSKLYQVAQKRKNPWKNLRNG